MKVNFKKILIAGIAGTMIAGFWAPVLVLARVQAGNVEQKAKAYCEMLSTALSKIDQRIAGYNSKLEEKRSRIRDRIEERRMERAAKVAEKRTKWDDNRAEHFAKLEEKAANSEQKQAVAAFTKVVSAAIAARRAAIDKANKDFQDSVAGAIAARKSAVDGIVAVFRNAVQAAFAKAKIDCQNDDPQTVRETLRAELKVAREKLAADRENIEKIKVSMEALIVAHRAAIKKANDDFKAALEEARVDFKAAMAKVSPSATP